MALYHPRQCALLSRSSQARADDRLAWFAEPSHARTTSDMKRRRSKRGGLWGRVRLCGAINILP